MNIIDFIYWHSLFPVDNGYKSTALSLLREISRKYTVRAYSLSWDTEQNDFTKEELEWYKTNKIIYKNISVQCPFLVKYFGVVRYRTFLKTNGFKNSWCKALTSGGIGSDSSQILFFSSGWDPVPITTIECFKNAMFMPADSITVFERSRISMSIISNMKNIISRIVAEKVEREYLRKNFSSIVYVSEYDAGIARNILNDDKSSKIRVVPIGINPDDYRIFHKKKDIDNIIILFTGVMEYLPNKDAANYLIHEILPHIKTTDIKILIAGKGGAALSYLKTDNVDVLDWVPSLRELQHEAAIFISPLRMGAGAKNNVIQALACGTPVVGTSKSFSGFKYLPPGAFICNNPKEFAETIDKLLNNYDELLRLGKEAQNYILENYSWEKTVRKLETLFNSALE